MVSGCFFAIRKLFCDEWHAGLTSDFYLPIVARQRGYRVVLAEQAIARYRVSQDASHEFRRKVRTVVNGLDVLATFKSVLNPVKSGMASFQMANHKLLRWMVPWLMIAVFSTNLIILDQHLIYRVTLGSQLLLYGTALVAVIVPRVQLLSAFRIPFFFVMVFQGVVDEVGQEIVDNLSGEVEEIPEVPEEANTVKVFQVEGKNFRFMIDGVETPDIVVNEGDTVRIEFTSVGGFHDWVVGAFSASTSRVNSGESTSVEFVADKKGTFEYYCSVGSHRSQGMMGSLIVQ